ncbi:MAG: alpha amylase C-terminal domain-containing protein [Lentisphaeria bacterium]|nr:alpha amylase C-terminal domain-containing protein [Lentisphaeria bacterium]
MTDHIPNRVQPLADDGWLAPFSEKLAARADRAVRTEHRLTEGRKKLADFASGHEYFGLHAADKTRWVFREWAPNATGVTIIGDFCDWDTGRGINCHALGNGVWEAFIPKATLPHGALFKLRVFWPGGEGDRLPTYARRVVQDPSTHIFTAQVWRPETPHAWEHPIPPPPAAPLIYEAHVGMAREEERVGAFNEFARDMLPRIAEAGYNTVQLMAVMEHPYYGSFGYHVSNFFAPSSRFGTPEDLKNLVDNAHRLGLRVIIDLIHSHAVRNDIEGLARFDGTTCQFFHAGPRGYHEAWDSCCFDYSKPEVLHFLLSNCRYWLDEFHVDGFRFDGITSMIYLNHGLGEAFVDYRQYFDDNVDESALTYLALANKVIHTVRPDAVTIAEDVSGMPGLGAPSETGGCGFDFRLAMGVTDYWFKLLDTRDEDWSMRGLWHELTNRRADEKTISYVECHDQAIVGGKTMLFTLLDHEMYTAMHTTSQSLTLERGIALHKLARLITWATAGWGYLNFMGNEFGHPEWIDFPREGNNWSYHYARRQWSLADRKDLRYQHLNAFDRAMLTLANTEHPLEKARPVSIDINDAEKVLVFERGGLFFLFNFHPETSYPSREVLALPGSYKLALNSDAPVFGGHDRVAPDQIFTTTRADGRDTIRVYLPSRTALVLKRMNQ